MMMQKTCIAHSAWIKTGWLDGDGIFRHVCFYVAFLDSYFLAWEKGGYGKQEGGSGGSIFPVAKEDFHDQELIFLFWVGFKLI